MKQAIVFPRGEKHVNNSAERIESLLSSAGLGFMVQYGLAIFFLFVIVAFALSYLTLVAVVVKNAVAALKNLGRS